MSKPTTCGTSALKREPLRYTIRRQFIGERDAKEVVAALMKAHGE